MNHSVGRVLYEIAETCNLPIHIWAVSMMYFHAYEEYSSEQNTENSETPNFGDPVKKLMLGITCLTISVKSNENYLNSQPIHISSVNRVQTVVDSAARIILSYTRKKSSTENILRAKRRVKDLMPNIELALMRIVGNSLQPSSVFLEAEVGDKQKSLLLELYSNPICLNYPPHDLRDWVEGHTSKPELYDAIRRYFI